MHIKIINPNTSAIFTQRNLLLGRTVASAGTEISAGQPRVGTASVECHIEEAIASIGVVEEVLAGESDSVAGYVIACFGDTGIHAAIILGRAGLSPLVTALTVALGVPVIEGVSVAVKMAEGLVSLGLRTSKVRSYGYPPPKPRSSAFFHGAFGGLAS